MVDLTRDNFLSSPINQEEEKPTLSRDSFLSAPKKLTRDNFLEASPAPGIKMNLEELAADDAAFGKISRFMEDYHGLTTNKNSREEIVDKWATNMRWFDGNSFSTINTAGQILAGDEEKKRTAMDVFDVWDNQYEGAFNEDASWSDSFGAVGDYAAAVLTDLTNYATVGAGTAVRIGAKKAGKEALKLSLKAAGTNEAKKAITKQAAKDYLKKGGITTMTADVAIGTGVELTRQAGLISSGHQKDLDMLNLSLVAMAGVAGGYTAYRLLDVNDKNVSAAGRGLLKEAIGDKSFKEVATQAAVEKAEWGKLMKGLETALEKYSTNPQDVLKPFRERVKDGGETMRAMKYTQSDKEFDFWSYLILGNADEGVKGLARDAYDAGIRFDGLRYEGDNISAMLGDVLQSMPEEYKDAFVSKFKDAAKAGEIVDFAEFTMEDIGDLFVKKASLAGQQLNVVSQARKVMNGPIGKAAAKSEPKTFGDVLQSSFTKWEPETVVEETAGLADEIGFYQSNFVRAVVSHPATTWLNVKGTQLRQVHSSISNMTYGLLWYGGKSVRNWSAADMKTAGKIAGGEVQRLKNMFAPGATFEQAESYFDVRGEVGDTLARWMSGGIDIQDMAKQFNIDLDKSVAARWTNNYVDLVQKASGAQAQDVFFKTQNFMYYLDMGIRKKYDMGYADFIEQPDFMKKMLTREFKELEAEAVDETLKSTFSKNFGAELANKQGLQRLPYEVANQIENIRKIPIIGAAAPFGQFWNNTISYMYEYGGPETIMEAAKFAGMKPRAGDPADFQRLMQSASKTFTTAIGVSFLMGEDEGNFLKGLSWNQDINEDGRVTEKKYDYPESLFRWTARALNHLNRDGEIPAELQKDFLRNFGAESFFRGITDNQKDIGEALRNGIQGENPGEISINGLKALGNIVALGGGQIVSGYMRPIDPINQLAGMLQGEDYKNLDRKQGIKVINDTFRYVDKLGAGSLMVALGSEEKNYPTRGPLPPQAAAALGFREIPGLTFADKAFASIGKPNWQAGIQDLAKTPGANNRVNAIYAEELNKRFKTLINNKHSDWYSLPLSTREDYVSDIVSKATKATKSKLLDNVKDTNDLRVWRLFNLVAKTSDIDLSRAKKATGIDAETDDLSIEEIRQLQNYVDKTVGRDIDLVFPLNDK